MAIGTFIPSDRTGDNLVQLSNHPASDDRFPALLAERDEVLRSYQSVALQMTCT